MLPRHVLDVFDDCTNIPCPKNIEYYILKVFCENILNFSIFQNLVNKRYCLYFQNYFMGKGHSWPKFSLKRTLLSSAKKKGQFCPPKGHFCLRKDTSVTQKYAQNKSQYWIWKRTVLSSRKYQYTILSSPIVFNGSILHPKINCRPQLPKNLDLSNHKLRTG